MAIGSSGKQSMFRWHTTHACVGNGTNGTTPSEQLPRLGLASLLSFLITFGTKPQHHQRPQEPDRLSAQWTTSSRRPTYRMERMTEGGGGRHSIFHCQCRALWFRPNLTYRVLLQANIFVGQRDYIPNIQKMKSKIADIFKRRLRRAKFAEREAARRLCCRGTFPFE